MLDPFARLGIPRGFAIDRKAAEKNHRELSRALHPDRYLGAAPAERNRALSEAADVNEAWRIVRDPIRRAEALFRLAGATVGETSEPKTAPSFLMEMMELRESLDEAKSRKDPSAVTRVSAEVDSKLATLEQRFAKLFSAERTADAHEAGAALGLLGELRFYARAKETIREIQEAFEDAGA